MRVRLVVAVATVVLAPIACVDLFHSTDFETRCDRDPASCGAAGDAARPLLEFCAWDPPTARARAIRTCAWLGACEGPLGETAFGRCVVRALSAYDCAFNPDLRPAGTSRALWSCLAQVETCADVDACVFGGAPRECAPVAAGSFTACAGNARVECARPERGRAVGVEPCELEGRKCVRIDDSRSTCAGVAGTACGGESCTGTSAIVCASSAGALVDRGRDCATLGGGSCVNAADAGVACSAGETSPPCSGSTQLRCEGATATSCVAQKRVAFDCRSLGVPCDTSVATTPSDPVAACAERTDAGRCAGADECLGDRLVSCANGARFEVSCASVGLGPCQKAPNDLAACTAPAR